MALINCKECGKQISEQAPTCVHCGAPSEKEELTQQQKALRIEVRDAFRDDKIDRAKPEELQKWLKTLSTTRTKYSKNYSRDIIRAAYINHVQNSMLIKELDKENKWIHTQIKTLTVILVVLTAGLIGLTIWLICIAKNTDDNIDSIYRITKQYTEQKETPPITHH